ncbi:MAG TPA: RCC1 repeat-containing protein, partial [Bacillota bacterium]|nr:RCC1 repeat-containing protein [Bacillota bacterium]
MKKLVWVLFILWILVIISSGCGSPTPKNLTPPIITAVAGGGGHTLALTSAGKLYAWGLNNKGQLGNGSTSNTDTPLGIALPSGVSLVALAAGSAHSVALTKTGQVYTWGSNQFGQLGIGSADEPHTPTLVPGLNGVIAISARYNHTVVLKDDGSVWAWGRNNYGQLGNNDALKQDRNSPVQVVGVN